MSYFGGYTPQYNQSYTMQPQMQTPMLNNNRMQFLQGMQSINSQPGEIVARVVTGREEAVAAQIIPDGNPVLFVDYGQKRIYFKRYDPNTGTAEFHDFVLDTPKPPEAPQYATLDMIEAMRGEIEQIRTALPAKRQTKGADSE